MLALSVHPRHVRRGDLRELGLYGANLQTASLVKVINAQSDKFVLLAYADLRFIGLYELGSRVAFSLRSLPVVAFGPLVAAAAAESASGAIERIRVFYRRMLAVTLRLAVAPLAALYGACYPLVQAWLGPGYETSAAICAVLGLGYTINIATGAGTSVANGAGRPQFDRDYSLLGLAINLVLTVALGALVGPWGVIVATTVGLALSTVWLMIRVDRWLQADTIGLSALWRAGLSEVLVGIAFGLGGVAAQMAVSSTSRWLSLALGVATVVTYGVTAMTIQHRWGTLIDRVRRPAKLAAHESTS
jgi:O-antigen/teichoic acid export membrane protein